MHRGIVVVALVAALSVVGCRSTSVDGTDGPAAVDGDWQLASGTVDGAAFPVVVEAPITLTVTGTTIGGRAACNLYSGAMSADGSAPLFRLMSMTEMACDAPVMAAEAAFLAAIARVEGTTRDGDRLTLSGPGVELVFDRLRPPPVAELVGTDWVLESLVTGDAVSSVSGEPATLRFEPDGTLRGSTGCRTFSGRWVTANGGIATPELRMDQTECAPELADQDGQIGSVLDGFRATVDGQMLTLAGADSEGLIYRAAPR
jgi:heat shock protein HslJ